MIGSLACNEWGNWEVKGFACEQLIHLSVRGFFIACEPDIKETLGFSPRPREDFFGTILHSEDSRMPAQ